MKDIIKKVYIDSFENFIESISVKLSNKQQSVIVTANPEIVMFSKKDVDIHNNLLDENTIITADGIGVVKAYEKYFDGKVNRITGVDIVEKLLDKAIQNNYKTLVYGSKQEVLDKLEEKMTSNNYFNGTYLNGYDYDVNYVREKIMSVKPNIVIVALGVPRQEQVVFELSKSTNGIIYIGCGGALDVLSGSIKRSPMIFQKLNIEWLYRIVKQPSRISRFFNNQVKFAWKVFRD